MTPQELDSLLVSTFTDRRLSRAERQALSEAIGSLPPEIDRDALRRRVFEIARGALTSADSLAAIDWLEDVVKTMREGDAATIKKRHSEAHFSPGDDCVHAIERLLSHARKTADICVFTITDDRLAEALLATHRRHVAMRILTDDAKAEDLGSDVERFERAGIPLRVDRSPFHMHHKFAIVDGETLLTGSYNWTRGAARDNEENVIVTNDPRLVSAFAERFEHLWAKLA